MKSADGLTQKLLREVAEGVIRDNDSINEYLVGLAEKALALPKTQAEKDIEELLKEHEARGLKLEQVLQTYRWAGRLVAGVEHGRIKPGDVTTSGTWRRLVRSVGDSWAKGLR